MAWLPSFRAHGSWGTLKIVALQHGPVGPHSPTDPGEGGGNDIPASSLEGCKSVILIYSLKKKKRHALASPVSVWLDTALMAAVGAACSYYMQLEEVSAFH